MKWKALVAELANRINQPHVIDIYMRKVYKAGIEEGKRKATLPEQETAALEGWVARNKSNRLQFYPYLPRRANRTDEWVIDCVTPSPVSFKKLGLSDSLFPSVTWESEPKKVRITLEAID